MLTIPDTIELEMINIAGKVLWSSIPSNIGQKIQTELFRQVFSGAMVYDVPTKILYVPIVRNQEVTGIFLLHRNNTRLLAQIQKLKNEVRIYITLFGGVLFLIMLAIIFSANRILRQQHLQSLKTNQSLKAAQNELNQIQQQLIRKVRLSTRGEICGAVAHGLIKPISSARSAVQLLAVRSLVPEE